MNALKRGVLGLLLLCGVAFAGAPQRTFKARNVVVLVIDGPRQSEMWDDPARTHIPHLAKELAPLGTLMTGFRNNGPTYTAAGHTTLCTGFYEEIENALGKQLPSHAGIFQHFRRSAKLPKEQVWLITSKDKLAILGNTTEAGWQDLDTPATWSGKGGKGQGSGYAEDADTVAKVKEVIASHHPRLMLINLKQPDAAGHSGSWMKYFQAIQESDAAAAEIWQAIQADPAMKDRTDCFITHDHGRHLDSVFPGIRSHGDACEGCRRIALLALGPDIKKNRVLPRGGEQIDLPVTVGAILGFTLPGSKGRVLKELFR
jgi:predicted AlkP superfamily pyrophosphatase or phosphodiesterase